ncbi:hypothetical protein [Rubrolithibacter danxiaensis]|uniref:hypothetical protein n=1 Tax=Rubrolithibacter danxiaensis TaxID=3390805 RepID=UPI003BF8F5D4
MNSSAVKPQTSPVNLLWTGGWDSTFRLIQLIIETDAIIQPVYIIDPERASTLMEITTMNKIRHKIEEKFPGTGNRILPHNYYSRLDIPEVPELSNKLKALKQESFIGRQYDFLSRLAYTQQISGLELAIHVDDKAHYFIKNKVVKKQSPLIGEYFEMDEDKPDESNASIFSYFRFPILNWSKVQMMKYAEEKEVLDIMMSTWFCHQPIANHPCGICNPCKYSIEEGMKFRFGKAALMRNKLFPIFRVKNAVFRRLNNLIESF